MRVAPARGIDPSRFLGTWKIVCSSYAFWRPMLGHVRTDAEVAYVRLDDARWSDVLRYRAPSWLTPRGARRERKIVGVDTLGAPGCFSWRGAGALAVVRNAWTVVAFDPGYAWIVTYVAPSLLGDAAIDLYARAPGLDAEAILSSACTTDVLRHAAIGMRTLPRAA